MQSTILAIIFFCAIGLSQSQSSGPSQSAIPHKQRTNDKSCGDDSNCSLVGRQETPNRDEPMKDDDDDDGYGKGYGIIDGQTVPKDNEIVKSIFKATYNSSDGTGKTDRHTTVNFVEKSHILLTAGHSCQHFRSGPHMKLGNGYTDDFTVNVYASFVPTTYLPSTSTQVPMSDVCLVVLNDAVPGVIPLKLAYGPAIVNETITVYGYGWYETKSKNIPWPKTSLYLKTGTVKVNLELNRCTLRVEGVTGQICPGDSGGACYDSKGQLFGVVQGGYIGVCRMNMPARLSQFVDLQHWMEDIIARFPVPPNQPGAMH